MEHFGYNRSQLYKSLLRDEYSKVSLIWLSHFNIMNNFIKEDDKQTILIVGDDGTKRYRVRPNQVKEVEEMLLQRTKPSVFARTK